VLELTSSSDNCNVPHCAEMRTPLIRSESKGAGNDGPSADRDEGGLPTRAGRRPARALVILLCGYGVRTQHH
jgi:hypothetical protein